MATMQMTRRRRTHTNGRGTRHNAASRAITHTRRPRPRTSRTGLALGMVAPGLTLVRKHPVRSILVMTAALGAVIGVLLARRIQFTR